MLSRKKIKTLLFLSLLFVTAFLPLASKSTVYAAGEQYSWDDSSRISVTGGSLAGQPQYLIKIGNNFDGAMSLNSANNSGGTQCAISVRLVPSGDKRTGTISHNPTGSTSGDGYCSPSSISSFIGSGSVTLNNSGNSGNADGSAEPIGTREVWVWAKLNVDATAEQIEAGHIDENFIPKTDTITLRQNGAVVSTHDNIAYTAFSGGQDVVEYFTRFTEINAGSYQVCSEQVENCVNFTKVRSERSSIEIPGKNDPIAIATDESGAQRSCETEGGDLGWFLCPVLRQLDNAVAELDKLINGLLQVPDDYFEKAELKATWARIRNIAYILLVPTILIMVLGTALGFELVSAYTVKKAMPRMIAAILFIALSYSITTFLIILTNNVGNGVAGLLTSSFGGDGTITLASLFSSNNTLDAGLFTGLLLGGLSAVAVTSFGILFSYALVTAVALFIAFVALSFRQLFLVALILLAPLAILTWIFPGNDKPWKLWWGTFSKLLLLYPLIMAVVGSGRAFARIVDDVSGNTAAGGDLVTTLIKLTAYVGPFFFIPAAFKFAGGLFANLAGMANDRGRGLFDTQRKKRAESRAALRERAGANNRFNPNRKIVKALKLNTLASIGADPMSNAFYYGRNIPGMSGKGQKIKSQIEAASSEQTGKLFEELNNVYKFNDKAYRALSGAHKFKGKNAAGISTMKQLEDAGLDGRAPRNMQEVQKMANILSQSNDATEAIAGNVLMGASGRLASLYADPEMGKANIQAAGMIGLSAHGFASGEDLAETGNQLINSGVSTELAQSFVSGAQVIGQKQRPDIKAGYGTVFKLGEDGKPKFVSGISEEGGRAGDLIKTLSSADLAQAKSHALTALTPTIVKTLKAGGGEAEAVKDQIFSWAGPYSQASVDVKRQALEIIDNPELANLQLRRDFDDYRRANLTNDPNRLGAPSGGGGEDQGGGSPPPGQ